MAHAKPVHEEGQIKVFDPFIWWVFFLRFVSFMGEEWVGLADV